MNLVDKIQDWYIDLQNAYSAGAQDLSKQLRIISDQKTVAKIRRELRTGKRTPEDVREGSFYCEMRQILEQSDDLPIPEGTNPESIDYVLGWGLMVKTSRVPFPKPPKGILNRIAYKLGYDDAKQRRCGYP